MIGHAPSDWVEFVYLAPYERFAKHEIPDEVERAFETAVVESPLSLLLPRRSRTSLCVDGLCEERAVRPDARTAEAHPADS